MLVSATRSKLFVSVRKTLNADKRALARSTSSATEEKMSEYNPCASLRPLTVVVRIPPPPNLVCTDVDWKGVVYGTQLAVHFMRKNKTPGGNIICTVSAAALYPHETYPEYDGAKAAVLNFIHATGRLLKAKENIKIGGVLPGIVQTNIIPPEMIAAVAPDSLTPVSTIVSAYQRLLDDESLAGKAIEAQVDQHFVVKYPEYLGGKYSQRACTVWEPLFKQYHGENSDLPGALP
jgi:hypothetical protein